MVITKVGARTALKLCITAISAATQVPIPYSELAFSLCFDMVDRDHDGALDREEMFGLVIKFIEWLDKKQEEKEAKEGK